MSQDRETLFCGRGLGLQRWVALTVLRIKGAYGRGVLYDIMKGKAGVEYQGSVSE